MKIKIDTVLTRLGAGGPPVVCVTLTRGLTSKGYEARLLVGRCDERHDRDMSYLLRPHDSVHWIPSMSRALSPIGDILALWRLFQAFRRTKPDIVHTHTAKAGTLGRVAARLAGVPVVVHTFHGNVLGGYFCPTVSRIVRAIEWCLGHLTDHVCVVSEQQARELSGTYRVIPRSKVRVVRLGLELDRFRRLGDSPRRTLGITVGWLGRFVPIKNLELLAEIVACCVRREIPVRFIVAGDGPRQTLVLDLVDRFGPSIVEWTGWVGAVESVIERCDVLIQTSKNEGTPVALIQGMAARRPFVSTAVGGVNDMTEGPVLRAKGGSRWFANAVLCEPRPESFADALEELAYQRDVLGKMGSRAAVFSRNFEFDALVRNLDELYRELLVAKGRMMPEAPVLEELTIR